VSEHLLGRGIKVGKVGLGILVELDEGIAMMVVRHVGAHRPPQTFGGIGFRIVRRRIDESDLRAVAVEALPQFDRAAARVNAEIVPEQQRDPPPLRRALDEMIDLQANLLTIARPGDAVGEPAGAPIDRAKGDELAVHPGGTHPPLTAPPFAGPGSGYGGMQIQVHFVLHVQVGARQKREQVLDIGRNVRPAVVIDQGVPIEATCRVRWRNDWCWVDCFGWGKVGRGGQDAGSSSDWIGGADDVGRRQEDLDPEAFPTQPSRSAALWATVQVGRLQT
jgi:hypothetical protein